jgi:hypothetical protein
VSKRSRCASSVLVLLFATAGFALAPIVAHTTISDLTAFLQRAEKMASFHRPMRADVRITRIGDSAKSAVVIVAPDRKAAFVASREDGFRALVPLGWKNGRAIAKTGTGAIDQPADALLDGLGFRAIDWFPPWAHDYTTAFISDETAHEKTVTIYGADSIPYTLFVVTFDKERMVANYTKYYRETFNNLVRLRRDEDYAMVGARPRPRKVTITDYVDDSTYVYEIEWSELAEVPASLFDVATFGSAEIEFRDLEARANPN